MLLRQIACLTGLRALWSAGTKMLTSKQMIMIRIMTSIQVAPVGLPFLIEARAIDAIGRGVRGGTATDPAGIVAETGVPGALRRCPWFEHTCATFQQAVSLSGR
jgi:hypothetical protein